MLYVNKVIALTTNRNIDILILGDSHTQTAINDSLLPNSFNFSSRSENYLYSYYKLLFYSKTAHINKLLISVSDHNISSIYDDFNENVNGKSVLYHNYLPILDIKGKWILFKTNPVVYFDAMKELFKYEIKYLLARNNSNINKKPWEGKYYWSKNSNITDTNVTKTIKRHFYNNNNGNLREYSNLQLEYLKQIMDYCLENKIELFLIKTPINMNYDLQTPLKFKNSFKQYEDKILDFSNISLNDSLFGDGDHLNYYGSLFFTKVISDSLYNLNVIKSGQ